MEELIATLEREAEERCAAMVAEAERQAEWERRAAEARMERRREEVRRALDEELSSREALAAASARTAIRRVLLRARRSALERVFRRARELLPEAVERPAWTASVPGEVRRALSCLGDTDVELTCPPALGELARAAAASLADGAGDEAADGLRLHVVERDDAPPGFLLRGMVTDVQVDATLPTRLAAVRPELEMQVLREMEESP